MMVELQDGSETTATEEAHFNVVKLPLDSKDFILLETSRKKNGQKFYRRTNSFSALVGAILIFFVGLSALVFQKKNSYIDSSLASINDEINELYEQNSVLAESNNKNFIEEEQLKAQLMNALYDYDEFDSKSPETVKYILKYTKIHPRCNDIACFYKGAGTFEELKILCTAHKECMGFSYSSNATATIRGCLKKDCDNKNFVIGYDMWEKQII